MKAKTKKQLTRGLLYILIFVFVAGTFLLYLPLTQPAPEPTALPLEQLPNAQQEQPLTTGAPIPAQ